MKNYLFRSLLFSLIIVGISSCQKSSSLENTKDKSLELFFNSYSAKGKEISQSIKEGISKSTYNKVETFANEINPYNENKVKYLDDLSQSQKLFLSDLINVMKENGNDEILRKNKIEELISQIPNRIEENERDQVYNITSVIYYFPTKEVKEYINKYNTEVTKYSSDSCTIAAAGVGIIVSATGCFWCGFIAAVVTDIACNFFDFA